MEIKEYLEDMTNLPLEKLKEKYGKESLYDNYRIFLSEDKEFVKNILEKSEKFELAEGENYLGYHFNYLPGITYIQLREGICNYDSLGEKGMRDDFKSHITMHPYQEKDMENIRFEDVKFGPSGINEEFRKSFSRTIKDLSEILIKNNIGFCFPDSSKLIMDEKTYKVIKERNYSEMAKFIPK